VELRPARAPHPPRVVPDPPGRPPGRVNHFRDQPDPSPVARQSRKPANHSLRPFAL